MLYLTGPLRKDRFDADIREVRVLAQCLPASGREAVGRAGAAGSYRRGGHSLLCERVEEWSYREPRLRQAPGDSQGDELPGGAVVRGLAGKGRVEGGRAGGAGNDRRAARAPLPDDHGREEGQAVHE